MKKYLLLLLFIPLVSFGQSIIVTPELEEITATPDYNFYLKSKPGFINNSSLFEKFIIPDFELDNIKIETTLNYSKMDEINSYGGLQLYIKEKKPKATYMRRPISSFDLDSLSRNNRNKYYDLINKIESEILSISDYGKDYIEELRLEKNQLNNLVIEIDYFVPDNEGVYNWKNPLKLTNIQTEIGFFINKNGETTTSFYEDENNNYTNFNFKKLKKNEVLEDSGYGFILKIYCEYQEKKFTKYYLILTY